MRSVRQEQEQEEEEETNITKEEEHKHPIQDDNETLTHPVWVSEL